MKIDSNKSHHLVQEVTECTFESYLYFCSNFGFKICYSCLHIIQVCKILLYSHPCKLNSAMSCKTILPCLEDELHIS